MSGGATPLYHLTIVAGVVAGACAGFMLIDRWQDADRVWESFCGNFEIPKTVGAHTTLSL